MRVCATRSRMPYQQHRQQQCQNHHHAVAKVRDPPAQPHAKDIDHQHQAKKQAVERKSQAAALRHPRRPRPQSIAKTRSRKYAQPRHRQDRVDRIIPRAQKRRRRSEGKFGPLIDPAFERPLLRAIADDNHLRQKEEKNSQNPENGMTRSLFGRNPRPGHAHQQHDLHRNQIPKPQLPP